MKPNNNYILNYHKIPGKKFVARINKAHLALQQ